MSVPWRLRLARSLAGPYAGGLSEARLQAGTVSSVVADGPGWTALSGRPHERDAAEIEALYNDALTAWRKNPLAKRAVDIIADYVVGDGISLTSSFPPLQAFIDAFWHHPRNQLPHRLETMCHELTLAGDLFPLLFRNPHDGMSYLRFVTKDRIARVETAADDWETETAYVELPRVAGGQETRWAGAAAARDGDGAVMLHYAVNRPLGALLGEGDLATMIPWLLRYSRLLEDRVRFHWAARAFLWFVTVPTHLVGAKQEQYRQPPEPGSIVVADDAERWEVKAPQLNGADASHDLEAVRRMVFTGSGIPPHWFGEKGSNRAEASAMQGPAERHLRRRQQYFVWLLEDLVFHAYQRARQARPGLPALPSASYRQLFTAVAPDISRQDSAERALAASHLASVWRHLVLETEPQSRQLAELLLGQLFRFMGEPQEAGVVKRVVEEMFESH
jgi:hypothetical protein